MNFESIVYIVMQKTSEFSYDIAGVFSSHKLAIEYAEKLPDETYVTSWGVWNVVPEN